MSVTDRIVRGFKAALGARVVDALANGVLLILLARVLLSADEYGLLFLTLAIVGVLQLAADLGISRSAARYVADHQQSEPGTIPFILRTSLRYKLLLIGIVTIGLLGSRDLVARALDTPELGLLLVVGVCYLAGQSLVAYGELLCQGFNEVTLSSVITVTNNVARLLAVVVLTAFGFGVAGALAGYALGAFLAAGVGLSYLYGFYQSFEDSGGSRPLRNRILKYSVPLTASQSAQILDRRIDTVLVGLFLNPLAVSYYVLSKQITEFVTIPAGSLGFSVSPTYGEQKANDELDRAARIYERTLESVLVLYVPAAVGLFLVAEPTVTLVFGTAYAGAAPVLQILAVYVVFQTVTNVTTGALDYLGRARDRAIAKGVTAVANVALNIALIPMYGVEGAAIATVVTFGLYTLVNVYIMQLELSIEFHRIARSLSLTAVTTVGMAAVVLVALPHASTLPALAGVIALGLAVWASLGVASGVLDIRESIALLT